jgi:hypothetical protein
MPSEDEIDALFAAFQDTAEFEAWDAFCHEAKKAIEAGKDRAELPLAFLRLAYIDIKTDPLMFNGMVKAWNRVCDERGMPEEKKKEIPEMDKTTLESPDGPF